MRETHITSLQNEKVKEAVHLRDRSTRNKTNLFLIEGYREIFRANEAGYPIKQLFYCKDLFLGTNEETLIQSIQGKGATIFSCTEPVFRKMAYRDRPDGLLAIATQQHLKLNHLEEILKQAKAPPFIVVAEAIEKPGNLGTILRSSDGVGAHGVIVCDPCTDIFNPNVVRASVGTLFTIPVIQCSATETLSWLKSKGISILAATPKAEQLYTNVDLTGPVAIIVGTEQLGLSDLWMKQADLQVKIPMLGVADSLNVATATTLLLYEVVRQRHG